MSDLKIKTAASKVPLDTVPLQALEGPSRVFQFGGVKYKPGNYYEASLEDGAGARYMGAAMRHAGKMQEPNGLYTAKSLAARDEESGLPHIDHLLCGLLMLRTIMIKCGALPADPGVGKSPEKSPLLFDDVELSTEMLLREARVANGGYEIPPYPRTGPGDE